MRRLAPLLLFSAACGGSGGGATGTYTAVGDAQLSIELRSGGKAVFNAGPLGSQEGTWRADGEKILLTVGGQEHAMTLDGACMEDAQSFFGRMCKGGKAGAASNVSTRTPPPNSGTWLASNTDGTFKLEFGSGNTVSLTATQAGGGNTDSRPGTYRVEGDQVFITLTQGEPLVLQWVNGAYESTSFGLPMKFVKQ